MFAFASGEEFV